MAYAPSPAIPAPFAQPAASRVYSAWMTATGQRADLDSDANAARSAGLAAGVDASWDNARLGLAAGYSSGRSRTDGGDSTLEADTFRVAAYGDTRVGALWFAGGASFGWSAFDSERRIDIGTISETASGDYDGYTGSLFGEVGYGFAVAGMKFEPFAGLTVTRLHTDDFTETGAPSARLSVGEIDETFAFSSLGVRVAAAVEVDGAVFVPNAKIGWRHAFNDHPVQVAMQFPTGSTFESAGLPIAKDSLIAGAGLESHLSSGLILGVAYRGDFADDARNHFAQAFARVSF